TCIVIICNIFTGFMFSVDPLTNSYSRGKFYNIIFIAPFFYALIIAKRLWDIEIRICLFLMFVVTLRVGFGFYIRSISSTSFFIALILTFAHIDSMNKDFYIGNKS
ncbi:MAG: hypothetical protein K6F99_01635, partial [Lachnospiraceae bacterium]|nr:hypothetical protein [Lachnospiraceae bacterium]